MLHSQNNAFGALFCLLGVLVFLSDFSIAAPVPTLEEIAEIEKGVIESRRSIQSGRVVVECKFKTFSAAPSQVGPVKRYTLTFDGDKKRSDETLSTPSDQYENSVIFTPDSFVRANSTDEWVQLFGPETRPKLPEELPDPLRLGLVAWHFETADQFGFEKHLLRSDREDVKIEAGTHNSEPVWKVSYAFEGAAGPVFTKYWLSIKQGHLPIYIAVSSGEGNDRYENSISCTLKEYQSGGV